MGAFYRRFRTEVQDGGSRRRFRTGFKTKVQDGGSRRGFRTKVQDGGSRIATRFVDPYGKNCQPICVDSRNLAAKLETPLGIRAALDGPMAKTFRELVAWQLAFQLNSEIQRLLKSGPAAKDFRFRDQLADSSRGVHRNIAEGFGRFNPTETMQFLDYAIASLDETESHLRDGVESEYFAADVVAPLMVLAARCRKAMAVWHSYLRTVRNNPRFNQARRNRRPEPSS